METYKNSCFGLFRTSPKVDKLNHWFEISSVLFIVFILSVQTLSAANPSINPPGRDGGFFIYVGKALRSGATLYDDIWDSKGPLIFWINALGVGADYSRWGVFFIELCFEVIALFIAYWIIKKQYGFLPALVTIIISSFLLKKVIGPGNSTEEYSILFTWLAIAALALLINNQGKTFWPFFIMGVTIVLNFLLRANNLGTQVIVILSAFFYVFNKQKEANFWHTLVYLVIGTLTVVIPISLYFMINGTFTAMIEASIIYNFAYSTAMDNPFSNGIAPAVNAFKGWFFIILLIWMLGIKYLFLDLRRKEFNPFLFVTVLALPVEALMSSISGRGYTHYIICWIPACMLLLAFGISILQIEAIKTEFRKKCETTHASFVLVFIIIFLFTVVGSFNSFYATVKFIGASMIRPSISREYREPASKVVNSLTNDADKVLVFGGQAGINIMAQRDSINGALFYPAINNSRIGIAIQKDFFENLKEEPPLLILDGHSLYPEQIPAINPLTRQNQRFVVSFSENLEQVLDWINTNYERYDEANGYIIYRLRSASQ